MEVDRTGGDQNAVPAEKPGQFAPTTHEIPQMPKKNYQLPKSASL
jgi:hypothetical protein